jgi:3-hydroxyacyl-[acyl-carrier-protein] dehydratase
MRNGVPLRFLFVDRVLELERDKGIIATRQITIADELFTQHFPGRPMMPASLLIEALAQAATILLEASSEFQCKAYVGYVANAKFRRPVVPGYEMRLEMKMVSGGTDGAVLTGVVKQRDKRCANIEIGMVTAPLAGFFPPGTVSYYHSLYDAWLEETHFKGFEKDPRERLQRAGP